MTQTDPLRLAVFGAAGATGQQLVRQAVERGHAVRALEVSWDGKPPMPPGVETREANVLSGDLGGAVSGCDVVISAIGLGIGLDTAVSPPPIYTEGTRAILAAMRAQGLSRLIVVSATFVGERDRGPIWFRIGAGIALDRVFAQMAEMERILRASRGIDWTAVRPGWLMNGELTADYTVAPDVIPEGLIRTRHADLAHFMLRCAETGEWSRQTPAIARSEPPCASSPDKLLREIAG